ncbi:MAG: hypothetical protein Tsb008_18200 [Rhodothalassiaceae bacterium]
MANRLMVVDDDEAFCLYVDSLARKHGWECRICTDSTTIERVLGEYAPDLLMLHIVMPGRDGIELVAHLTGLPKDTRILFVSASRSDYLSYARAISETRLERPVETRMKPLRPDDFAELLNGTRMDADR